MRAWIAESQGARSASVSGIPWLIFSTLARECSESPSRNGHGIASANSLPIVVFPDPATPITTTITDALGIAAPELFIAERGERIGASGAQRRQHGGEQDRWQDDREHDRVGQ